MTRVLHLSDVHFGHPAVPEQYEAIERFFHEERFDVVALSGDLTQRARSGEFQRARALLKHAQQVSRTIVIPGNHDVAWWRAPLGFGESERMYERYRAYIDQELEPVLRVPGATFVGINTAQGVTRHALTWRLRDISIIGVVRRQQIERARAEFEQSPESDARVIVMHHNPMRGELSGRHGLKDTKKVLGAFADLGVDLVLCGHDHQEAVHYVEHTRKGTVISTAGTVSNRVRGGRPSSLNTITIREASIDVETRVWSEDLGTFSKGPVQCFER
jgi:3',5'-cyclic AMP phosphodiesterase CpdA